MGKKDNGSSVRSGPSLNTMKKKVTGVRYKNGQAYEKYQASKSNFYIQVREIYRYLNDFIRKNSKVDLILHMFY
jgi:hypothetical protein